MFLIFREIPADFPQYLDLSPEEYRHLRARRMLPGAVVQVGDGRGRRLGYRLDESGDRVQRAASEIEQGHEESVELFTAVPEGRRWDWLLQKATELGVTVLQPVVSVHSEARRSKREREERIILEAAIQSQRFVLPVLRDPVPLSQASRLPTTGSPEAVLQVALDPRGKRTFVDYLLDQLRKDRTISAGGAQKKPLVRIFIGPEGGFSVQELDDFEQAGASICRLGATILRIETAAVAGLACFATIACDRR